MCMKDVRMGRAKTTDGTGLFVTVDMTGERVFINNARRAGLTFSMLSPTTPTPGQNVMIRKGGFEGPVLAVLTEHSPHWEGHVEQWGDGITGDIWLVSTDNNDPEVYCSEAVWLSDPEDA